MSERSFEDLLADPYEQFDLSGEVAASLLASVAEYMNAPTSTASTAPPRPRSVPLRVVPTKVCAKDTPPRHLPGEDR
jgi:hypothetical protein